MRFDDKTKKIICGVVAVAMIVPILIGVLYMFIGA